MPPTLAAEAAAGGGFVGEAAALAAAGCWVVTAMAFTGASRRIGAFAVNAIRIVAALGLLLVLCRVLFGGFLPEVPVRAALLFAVSGLVGLVIGDQCFFASMVAIGPRVATLIGTTLAPPVAAALAWPILDEPLDPWQLAGMAITLGGIAVVLLERPAGRGARAEGDGRSAPGRTAGVLLAAGAGVCQGSGLVLSKVAMGHAAPAFGLARAEETIDPWIATTWRMLAAAAAVTVIVAARRGLRRRAAGRSATPRPRPIPIDRVAAAWMVGLGTLLGPVCGVWLSMVAVDRAEAGPASTLMATTPILILPVVRIVERERIGARAVAGAVVAVAGVAVLALSGRA